jgi:hypothetical protein
MIPVLKTCNTKLIRTAATAKCGPASEALERATKRPRTASFASAALSASSFDLNQMFYAISPEAEAFPSICWDSDDEFEAPTSINVMSLLGKRERGGVMRCSTIKSNLSSLHPETSTEDKQEMIDRLSEASVKLAAKIDLMHHSTPPHLHRRLVSSDSSSHRSRVA